MSNPLIRCFFISIILLFSLSKIVGNKRGDRLLGNKINGEGFNTEYNKQQQQTLITELS